MPKVDLILLHAPSVYDFRKKAIIYGPISDVVPSTQIFEMYPIGFMTILEYLQRHGYLVRIINVALKMLRNPRFDAEKLIRSLNPAAFGLDLHWMVHAQGSLELASIVKKYHPETPVIFGGLSASYYHEELVLYPQVDYVIRGDSAEEPLRQLLSAIKEKRSPEDVPNLTWKNSNQVRINELSYVPSDLNSIAFDYRKIMRSSTRHFDIVGHMPFRDWLDYPILAALSCRGCVHNCIICGGSASAHRRICGRSSPAYRSAELVAQDIVLISQYIRAPIFLLGDILQAGPEYARDLLSKFKGKNIKNHIAFEFFSPPSRQFLEMVAETIPNFNMQISPESHDEDIRRTFGRAFNNDSLERSIKDALELGCKRVDVFFMIGLSGQTSQSVMETIRYCEELLEKYGRDGSGKIHPYISPLAPFLDPGSRAFEDPEKYGYRLFYKTLEEHRQALLQPSWKYLLNYETEWMSRDELVASTYEAALELNRLKARYGLIKLKEAEKIEFRIEEEKELIWRIDEIVSIKDKKLQEKKIEKLRNQFNQLSNSTICRKEELRWPVRLVRFNLIKVIREAFLN
ncbi:TIGR04190 family B12-binding domain/radical SAM domain protein [Candidatus Latescibacterota bacterium]